MQGVHMQLRHLLAATGLLLSAAFAPWGSVRADTVLYANAGFIQGNQSFVDSFSVTTPGTLTISLADVPWLDTLSDLNVFLTSASGPLGASMGVGTETMQVGPGTFYAHWFGEADGQYKLGVYSLKIMFQPQGVSAVPLPGSLILLLSGLTLAFFRRRRRSGAGESATSV
jgi:hypothetical protein